MPFERLNWNLSDHQEAPKQEQNTPPQEGRQHVEPSKEEAVHQQESQQAEPKMLMASLMRRIGEERLKEEAIQELEQKGVYNRGESKPSLIAAQNMLLEMLYNRNLSAKLSHLAVELPEGQEKAYADNLSDDFFSYSMHLERQYQQNASTSDLGSQRYNGEPTAESYIEALANLHRADLMSEIEFESLKAEALRKVEEKRTGRSEA